MPEQVAEKSLELDDDSLRRLDPDRWLSGLFAPDSLRMDLYALYAFNLEIARSRETVSEAMLGHIRLQWWREAIQGIEAGTPRRHPVVLALHEARARLDIAEMLRLIDARERDMEAEAFADRAALFDYARETSAPLMILAAKLLGAEESAALTEAARLAGTAYALVGILRAVPYHAAQGRVLLPADLLAAEGATPEAVQQEKLGPEAFAAMRRLGQDARGLIAEARRISVPRAALPALLPLSLAALYLKRLETAGFNPEDPRLAIGMPRKQIELLIRAGLGRF